MSRDVGDETGKEEEGIEERVLASEPYSQLFMMGTSKTGTGTISYWLFFK
jgi:hypothetical protein